MPKLIPWAEMALDASLDDADALLDQLKSFEITMSNTMACTLCLGEEPHKKRYRLLECSSEACKAVGDFKCPWRGKMLTCLKNDEISLYQFGDHLTELSSPKKKKLTLTQKTFCQELAEQRLRPMRIRHAMSRKFATPLEDLPELATVQNFVNHYSRTYLENHDRVDDLRKWIHARAYTGGGGESMEQTFTFGWDMDADGRPAVGNGSEARPFIVGLTNKALVLRLMTPPESFILHVDATYKLNHREYPVLVVGVSDRCRGFHVVALFVISQETQPIIESALLALRRVYFWVTRNELVVQYAMADADQAQFNALHAVFGRFPRFQSLMCLFHVMANVQKAVKGFPSLVSSSIVRDLYGLHFARSEPEYQQLRDAILQKWMRYPYLVPFAQYMCAQWLYVRFSKWQVYVTPSGFASTNNPAETFNAVIKRDYTLRRRLKMGTLLKELSDCCADQASNVRPFRFEVVPSPTLVHRMFEMTRENLLGVWTGNTMEADCAEAPKTRRVFSQLAKRIVVAPNKRSEEGIAVSAQMGANYARMEVAGQPWGGWVVDLEHRWCACSYCFAFGVCVHVLAAVRHAENVDCSGNEILVSRKKRKRGAVDPQRQGGCPPLAGPALTF